MVVVVVVVVVVVIVVVVVVSSSSSRSSSSNCGSVHNDKKAEIVPDKVSPVEDDQLAVFMTPETEGRVNHPYKGSYNLQTKQIVVQ